MNNSFYCGGCQKECPFDIMHNEYSLNGYTFCYGCFTNRYPLAQQWVKDEAHCSEWINCCSCEYEDDEECPCCEDDDSEYQDPILIKKCEVCIYKEENDVKTN